MAIYECWSVQGRTAAVMQNLHPTNPGTFSFGKTRYVLPSAILTIAGILTAFGADGIRSTYICPHSAAKIIPFLQISGTFLDAFALISIENVVRRMKINSDTEDAAVPKVAGSLLIVSRPTVENPLVLTFESCRLHSFSLVA